MPAQGTKADSSIAHPTIQHNYFPNLICTCSKPVILSKIVLDTEEEIYQGLCSACQREWWLQPIEHLRGEAHIYHPQEIKKNV